MYAVEVAPVAAQGEAQSAGVEMEQRLLLNGIRGYGGYQPVIEGIKHAFPVVSHSAHAQLVRAYVAAPGANMAAHTGAGLWVAHPGLYQVRCGHPLYFIMVSLYAKKAALQGLYSRHRFPCPSDQISACPKVSLGRLGGQKRGVDREEMEGICGAATIAPERTRRAAVKD
jgi:hypothetical protein